MTNPIRIMSVDDNQLVRETLERRFTEAEGFEWCGGLPDASCVLEKARTWAADVILLDLGMPGPDSFAAMRKLSQRLPNAKVVVLSGTVTPKLVDRALGGGASGYLSKADEGSAMVEVALRVAAGDVAIGPEVRAVYGPLSEAQRRTPQSSAVGATGTGAQGRSKGLSVAASVCGLLGI